MKEGVGWDEGGGRRGGGEGGVGRGEGGSRWGWGGEGGRRVREGLG